MLQRSCHLIKSVSSQTSRQTDGFGFAVRGLFKGYSRRQLHSVVYSVLRSNGNAGIQKIIYMHKHYYICPRRELVWSLSYMQKCPCSSSSGKGSQGSIIAPSGKPNQHVFSKAANDHSGKNNIPNGICKNNTVKKTDEYQKVDSTLKTSCHKDKIGPEENVRDKCGIKDYNGAEHYGKISEPTYVCKMDHDNNKMESGTNLNYMGNEYGGSSKEKSESDTTKEVNQIPVDQEGYEPLKSTNDNKIQKSSNIFITKAKNLLRKSSKSDEQTEVATADEGTSKIASPATQRKRPSVDLNKCSTERNFITPARAMTDFLLKPSDLEGLRKTKRRSPYENDPPITVYWRKDVEAKAIDIWGSKENLLKEILKRDIERRRYQQNIFTIKRRLREYRREQGRETEFNSDQNGLGGASGKVVLTATFINCGNALCKFAAWWYTGSHTMFAEAIHSLADTINQFILAYGIHKSVQRANSDHPYGYTNMRYVSSLISGVGIFCLGSGLSFYHGIVGLTDPTPVESYYYGFLTLAFSFVTEGATLLLAFNSIRQGAKINNMKVLEYVMRGSDPSVSVILLEDLAAVIGVVLAVCTTGMSAYTGSTVPDAIGSLLVCGLLAVVAAFIIYTNSAALVGRSIPQERLDKINAELESDVMIRAIHDVKGIDMGNSLVRYKAEMDFDGGALTRSYLDKQNLNQLLEEVQKFTTIDELEEFMLKHGENIVDMLGGEIDRIELKLR